MSGFDREGLDRAFVKLCQHYLHKRMLFATMCLRHPMHLALECSWAAANMQLWRAGAQCGLLMVGNALMLAHTRSAIDRARATASKAGCTPKCCRAAGTVVSTIGHWSRCIVCLVRRHPFQALFHQDLRMYRCT